MKSEITYDDIPVQDVIEGMKHLKSVLVIGLDHSNDIYMASSSGDNVLNVRLAKEFLKFIESKCV